MKGPVYWHPVTYRAFMRLLYGSEYRQRYLNVVSEIHPDWAVLDVCCGDCYLYHLLRGRNPYLGIDCNPKFVQWAKRLGIRAILLDVRNQVWPEADCVVILGSLYQFIPSQKEILKKGLAAARRRLIVSEPCLNLAQHSVWLSRLSSVMITPGVEWSNERFTPDKLISAYRSVGCSRILNNGRELLGIFDTA